MHQASKERGLLEAAKQSPGITREEALLAEAANELGSLALSEPGKRNRKAKGDGPLPWH
ncbi:hypothetical protein D3C76_1593100 [compost metagenome]